MAKAKLARSGRTSVYGKLAPAINGLQLPMEIEEIHRRRASDADLPLREYLRWVLTIAAVGVDEMKRAENERISSIAGKLNK